MEVVLQSLLTGGPVLVAHLAAAFALLALATTVYTAITPIREMELIRQGNQAAAISLGGGILGMALPLAACLAASVSLTDLVVWGIVILMIQLAALRMVDVVLGDLRRRIEGGETAAATIVAAVKLAVAALTAAAAGG
jgi:putative membrane protein